MLEQSDATSGACELTASSHRDCSGDQVLKSGDTFLLVDRLGEIGCPIANEQGLYHAGTRYLSAWSLRINGERPMLLSSTMKLDNSLMIAQSTTPNMVLADGVTLPHGTLHLFRSLIVQGNNFYEHLKLTNYFNQPLRFPVEYHYTADYADIFEIRGLTRDRRGADIPEKINGQSVTLGYRGLDDRTRETRIEFENSVECVEADRCRLVIDLDVGQEFNIYATVSCDPASSPIDSADHVAADHAAAVQAVSSGIKRTEQERTKIVTSNEQFNAWIDRSVADLQMLTTQTTNGAYPYAGVPWFATPFGRDGIITALETLWAQPEIACGVLSFLAATQATEIDSASEAEPGKIIHEMRSGELAALGEIPFRQYYGTVDATPLFVMLAGEYYRRTGDRDFIASIWENIRQAVTWIDEYGDSDGDGFIEYQSHHDRGLVHQCWKDSNDSIFHADGSTAQGPIAVSEVQGYVYAAKRSAAELAILFGETDWATRLNKQAKELKKKFNQMFWVQSLGTFAIALDGKKKPCEVHNSNAGHLLFTGIAKTRYAESVSKSLTCKEGFNGWGIRTISDGQARFNPMSYHNGSVWPHDTAIGIAGMSRYDMQNYALPVAEGLFDASTFNDLHRLPELFCGFTRLHGHSPTLYPVACSPQAWAAGAVFMVLQAMMGLRFSPTRPQIVFENPLLPPYLHWIRIEHLRVANGSVDLVLRRHPRDVGLNVERKEGDVQLVVIG